MDPPPDDLEFLVSSAHRIAVLESLRSGPRDRDTLRSVTGASSPTMSRILADFERRNWVERQEGSYALTSLGVFVADRLGGFVGAMTIEQELRDVWDSLPHDLEGFDAGLFEDVRVTRPNPGYPDRAIERRIELIEGTTTWRGAGVAMLGLRTLETSFDRFLDPGAGLHCEYIYPPEVFEELLSWGDTEAIVAAIETEQYTVLLHEDLPLEDRYELCLFDECVTICCYDEDQGGLRALVETTSREVRAWAESTYERLRAEATPLEDTDRDWLSAAE